MHCSSTSRARFERVRKGRKQLHDKLQSEARSDALLPAYAAESSQQACRHAHQVCKRVGVVEAGVAGGCDDISQVVGRQAEVGHLLKVTVLVLEVHTIVLHMI